ncbi:kinase-like protein [Acrodontium crateriforme]|uniref:Kinase-like protein n=1 Tax=Acrodontium crateriforme TaxID=150365 RepID=A0AAQ3LZX4_9PEZI|nr:kinase-like protein [Acrodontium crateriforme]
MYISRLLSKRRLSSVPLNPVYGAQCLGVRCYRATGRLRQSPDLKHESDLFNYTSGRWVYNENLRQNERQRHFNVSGLKRLAAESVQRNVEDVVHFEKLAEGGFNCTFLIRMRDGFELVARIPYPVTEPKQLLVASEAATMTFLCLHGLPVPQIYGYSTTVKNAAGTEYILTEFIRGTNLGDVWNDMTEDHLQNFVTSLVKLESRLLDITFPTSGSLYFAEDLPAGVKNVPIRTNGPERVPTFCIGPETSFHLWFGRRSGLQVDRGPFIEPETVPASGAKKEMAYLQAFGRQLYPFQRIRREVFACPKQSPSPHLETLDKYLQVAPSLMSKNNPNLLLPSIRHLDLNPGNIFVSKDFEITSLIDWQHCSILPLFLQCGIPKYLENYKDPVCQSLDLPQLPSKFEELNAEEQAKEIELLRKRQFHYFYVTAKASHNKAHLDALTYEFSAARRKVYEQSGNSWEGDNITLKFSLIHLVQNWEQVVGKAETCPISFTPEEIQECLRLEAELREADAEMQGSKEILGIGPEGWVPCEHYERVKNATMEMKADMIANAESEMDRDCVRNHYVYDDMDEDEYL